MAMTNAERQKKFRQKRNSIKPESNQAKPAPMTNAERARNYRERQSEIKCEQLNKEREERRKEIIEYVKTMPEWKIDDLYKETVEKEALLSGFDFDLEELSSLL